jgi:hypothetical protein
MDVSDFASESWPFDSPRDTARLLQRLIQLAHVQHRHIARRVPPREYIVKMLACQTDRQSDFVTLCSHSTIDDLC